MSNKLGKIIILSIINILVWGGYAFALFEIKTGEANMDSLEEAMKENLRKQKVQIVLTKNLDDTFVNREKMNTFLIKKESEVDFIKNIEDLVSESNLKSEIKSVKVEPVASSSSLENLSVKIDVIGEWSDILNFQRKIETIPLLLTIDSYDYSKFGVYVTKTKEINQWLGSFSFHVTEIKE